MGIETWELLPRDHWNGDISGGSEELGFLLRQRRSGLSDGVFQLEVVCGDLTFDLLPTRGMSIWKAACQGIPFGWRSPIAGPVHPKYVPLAEPSGLGWLDGFDEMFVRCGLTSNGAPEFDESGRLQYPLHGRIANQPANDLRITIDTKQQQMEISATVRESRFHFSNLELRTSVRCQLGHRAIHLSDQIVNRGGRSAVAQILYHINFGEPLLEAGAKLVAPIAEVAPRDVHAANFIERWTEFEKPQPGFEEQVYFANLIADSHDRTGAMIHNAAGSLAAYVIFNRSELPCFTLWKDTGDLRDGYVAGLEPGSNYPNRYSFEAKRGRVIKLEPGGSYPIQLELGFCADSAAVSAKRKQIETIQAKQSPRVLIWPDPEYSPAGGDVETATES